MYSTLAFQLPEVVFDTRQRFLCMTMDGKQHDTRPLNVRSFQMSGHFIVPDLRCPFPVRPNPVRPSLFVFNKPNHMVLKQKNVSETGHDGPAYCHQGMMSFNDVNNYREQRFLGDLDIANGSNNLDSPTPEVAMDSSYSCVNSPDLKKAFSCPQCKYTTDRKNNLKRHVITMHFDSDRKLECCGANFRSKAKLREHVILFHKDGYRCLTCSRIFCRKALLRRHMAVHSGKKDFVCNLCDYATSHKSNLERHQKVHLKSQGSQKCDVNANLTHRKFIRRNLTYMSEPEISYKPYIPSLVRREEGCTFDEHPLTNENCLNILDSGIEDQNVAIIETGNSTGDNLQRETISIDLKPAMIIESDKEKCQNVEDGNTHSLFDRIDPVEMYSSASAVEKRDSVKIEQFDEGLGVKRNDYMFDENCNNVVKDSVALNDNENVIFSVEESRKTLTDKINTDENLVNTKHVIESRNNSNLCLINRQLVNYQTFNTDLKLDNTKRISNAQSNDNLIQEHSVSSHQNRSLNQDESLDSNYHMSEIMVMFKQFDNKENLHGTLTNSPDNDNGEAVDVKDAKRLCVLPYRCASCRHRFNTQTQFLRHICDVINDGRTRDTASAFSLVAKIIKMGHI